jgi:hypothetical protein
MLYFTKYANNKFDILNKHKIYLRKEQIEDAVGAPDKTIKKGKYFISHKDGIEAVYQKEDGMIKIITFYPVK